MSIQKEIGRVKKFNASSGFGFIEKMGLNEDVFVHHSEIQMGGYKSLRVGDYVLFSLTEGPKGYHARGVHLLTPDEAFKALDGAYED